jgi:hypothetical protein
MDLTTTTPGPWATGTRWCAIAKYADGSGILGVFGPYPTKAAADNGAKQLREIGVHMHDEWIVMPVRRVDPGTHDA